MGCRSTLSFDINGASYWINKDLLVNYKIEKMYKLGILLPLEIFSSTFHLTRQPEGPSMACNGAYSVAVLYLTQIMYVNSIIIFTKWLKLWPFIFKLHLNKDYKYVLN